MTRGILYFALFIDNYYDDGGGGRRVKEWNLGLLLLVSYIILKHNLIKILANLQFQAILQW